MISFPFEIKKDLSINNSMKIPLTSEKLKNKKTDITNLKVFLTLTYHLESFEFILQASTKMNETTKNLEFNMGDILETIFSSFGQNFFNDYFLSYYLDNIEVSEKDNKNNNIKTFQHFGEINLETIQNSQNLFFKIPKDNTIYLKLWQKIKRDELLDPNYFEENENEFSNQIFQEINLEEEEEEKSNKKGSGRDKEKTIGFAIIKVCKWEKIIQKCENNITLDDAAKCVGMAKKTLDDYKNQIQLGREKKFNFNKYYKCKMNVLKKFNKGKLKLD